MTIEEKNEIEAEFHYLMATRLCYDIGGSLADLVEETLSEVLRGHIE